MEEINVKEEELGRRRARSATKYSIMKRSGMQGEGSRCESVENSQQACPQCNQENFSFKYNYGIDLRARRDWSSPLSEQF